MKVEVNLTTAQVQRMVSLLDQMQRDHPPRFPYSFDQRVIATVREALEIATMIRVGDRVWIRIPQPGLLATQGFVTDIMWKGGTPIWYSLQVRSQNGGVSIIPGIPANAVELMGDK